MVLRCLPISMKRHTTFTFKSLYPVHKLISIHVHVNCELDRWPLTYKINRVHPQTMANMSAKFDEEAHNGLVSIMFTSLLPYKFIVTLTSKINRVRLLTMANTSAKFDEEAHNGLIPIVSTSLSCLLWYTSIVTFSFDLWSPNSIEYILSLWLACLSSLMKKHTTV